MTQTHRLYLTEQFVAFLDAGRPDLTAPIMEAAEHDPELAQLLGDVSLGMAEDDGLRADPGDADRTRSVIALAAASASGSVDSDGGDVHPHPFMTLAVRNTGKRPSEIANALGTTVEFIDDANDYPEVVGRPTVLRLVDLSAERLGMPHGPSLYAFEHNRPMSAMAASRDGAADPTPPTFDEIIARSQMNDDDAELWRSLHAEGGDPS